MIEAFEVGSSLVLTDLVSPRLLKIAERATKFEEQLLGVQKRLEGITKGAGAFAALNKEMRGTADNTRRLNENLFKTGGLALKVSERMDTIKAGGINRATTAVNNLSHALLTARSSAFVMGDVLTKATAAVGTNKAVKAYGVVAGAAAVNSPARASSGFAAATHANSPTKAYGQPAVAAMMGASLGYGPYRNTRNPSGQIGQGGHRGHGGRGGHGGIHGPHMNIGGHGMHMGGFGIGGGDFMPGMMTAGAGMMGLGLVGRLAKHGSELGHQVALLGTLGIKQPEINQIIKVARDTSVAVPTTTTAENLEAIRELRSAFGYGHEQHALSVLPQVQMMKGALTALTGKEQNHVAFDAIKAIELRSPVMTETAIKRNANMMLQTMMAMGGTINVNDFHQALKYGKAATMGWSDEFVYKYLPTLMQEVKTKGGGAQSAGTMAMTTYRAIVGGKMQKSAYPNWIASGLVSPSDVVKNATGQWQMKPGAIHGNSLFVSDPFMWSQKFLAPAVQKLMASKHISLDTALASMFTDRNAEFMMRTFLVKAQQFERDKKLIEHADGMQAYQKLVKTDPNLASLALHKQWENLLAEIGYTIMPSLIHGTQKLIPVLRDLTKWVFANPKKVEFLVKAFAALSAVLVGLGSLLIVRAGFTALKGVLNSTGTSATSLRGKILGLGRWLLRASMFVLRFTWRLIGFAGPVGRAIVIIGTLGVLVYKNWATIKKYTGAALDWIINKAKWLWDHFKGARNAVGKWIGEAAQSSNEGFQPSAYHTPASGSIPMHFHIHHTTYLDGRKVAENVTHHQSKAMNRPQTGISGFDRTMGFSPATI